MAGIRKHDELRLGEGALVVGDRRPCHIVTSRLDHQHRHLDQRELIEPERYVGSIRRELRSVMGVVADASSADPTQAGARDRSPRSAGPCCIGDRVTGARAGMASALFGAPVARGS